MPEIIIVAGPNGAGKTSFARQHINTGHVAFTFVNADEIARSLPPLGKSQAAIDLQATREMLKRMDELATARLNFMVETTLAALTYLDKIAAWQRAGYTVTLIFLRLPNVEYAIERVQRRVAAGGHDIPEDTIRRRFAMGREYLEKYYKQAVDVWYVIDSFEGTYVLADWSEKSESRQTKI